MFNDLPFIHLFNASRFMQGLFPRAHMLACIRAENGDWSMLRTLRAKSIIYYFSGRTLQ